MKGETVIYLSPAVRAASVATFQDMPRKRGTSAGLVRYTAYFSVKNFFGFKARPDLIV
ncbi:MAG TPA: hypothetical protein PKY81_16820 [bacterium]|nr:hypothetical protein [bacterium]